MIRGGMHAKPLEAIGCRGACDGDPVLLRRGVGGSARAIRGKPNTRVTGDNKVQETINERVIGLSLSYSKGPEVVHVALTCAQ